MDWGTIIGAGISTAGGIASTSVGTSGRKRSQARAFKYNQHFQARQFKFERKNYNKRFQRTVRDMRKAGLNPAMMYQSGGQPGSAPGGSSPGMSAVQPDATGIQEGIRQGVDAAIEMRKTRQFEKESKAKIRFADAQTALKNVETMAAYHALKRTGSIKPGMWNQLLLNLQHNVEGLIGHSARQLKEVGEKFKKGFKKEE